MTLEHGWVRVLEYTAFEKCHDARLYAHHLSFKVERVRRNFADGGVEHGVRSLPVDMGGAAANAATGLKKQEEKYCRSRRACKQTCNSSFG
jgi:hypothetical protein